MENKSDVTFQIRMRKTGFPKYVTSSEKLSFLYKWSSFRQYLWIYIHLVSTGSEITQGYEDKKILTDFKWTMIDAAIETMM